jgi:DNA-binding Lrp family transcriptional regulator
LLPQGGDGVDALDFQLLNDYQRDLPLVAAPFARIGSALGIGEAEVIKEKRDLLRADHPGRQLGR